MSEKDSKMSENDRKAVEEIIDKKILDAKLTVTESRLNHLIILAAGLLTIFGILVPFWTTYTSSEKTDKAIDRMEQRFKELAGEALKKPALELLHKGEPLENQTVDVDGVIGGNALVSLQTIFLKNTGNKRTEPLSIKFLTQPLLRREGVTCPH